MVAMIITCILVAFNGGQGGGGDCGKNGCDETEQV